MARKLGKRQAQVLAVLAEESPGEYTRIACLCHMTNEWGARPAFDTAMAGLERAGYARITKEGFAVIRWTIEITPAGRAALAAQGGGTDG